VCVFLFVSAPRENSQLEKAAAPGQQIAADSSQPRRAANPGHQPTQESSLHKLIQTEEGSRP